MYCLSRRLHDHLNRHPHVEQLESKRLLAGDLTAFWSADDLDASLYNDGIISSWTDSVGGIEATAHGIPRLVPHSMGSQSGVRFNGSSTFVIPATTNPISGAAEFSASVTFRTLATNLAGDTGHWFTNSGLLDMSRFGFSPDWGLSINRSGQIATGMGRGFQRPIDTLRSEASGFNDDQVHVATVTRDGPLLSLYVDGKLVASHSDVGDQPRGQLDLRIGAINNDGLGFHGEIASVRLFDAALTLAEVTDLYSETIIPRSVDDIYAVKSQEPLVVDSDWGIASNDTSYVSQQLSVVLTRQPERGILSLADDGSFTYVPDADFTTGVDTFQYQSTDGVRHSSETSVTFAVNTPEDTRKIVINELHVNPDVNTELVEFIELHNPTKIPIHMGESFFSDGITYSLPTDTVIPAGGYYVITENAEHFREKFGFDADGQWQGKLSNGGETVVYRSMHGDLIDRVDYGEGFPWPTVGDGPGYSMELLHPALDNQLGGSWRSSVGSQTIVDTGSDGWRYFKGTAEPSDDPQAWRQIDFDDSHWLGGVLPIGFSRTVPVATQLDDMRNNYSTLYLRKEFQIEDVLDFDELTIRAFFDDGINIWINGVPVASQFAPAQNASFDSLSTGRNRANQAVYFQLSEATNYLVEGRNVIAVQLFNDRLRGSDAVFDLSLSNPARSAPGPTPGHQNSMSSELNGPQLRQVRHTPQQPTSGQDTSITVKATDPDDVALMTLEYQVVRPGEYISTIDSEFHSNWTSIPMYDDGTHGDALSGDSIYTSVISGDHNQHRHLIRFRIRGQDGLGNEVRVPYADDPQPNFAYFVYDGIPAWTGSNQPGTTDPVTYSTDVTRSLPALHLISHESDVADSNYNSRFNTREFRFQGTLVAGDAVYDHIRYRIRGQFSTYVTGKNKWKVKFNRGHEFQGYDQYGTRWPEKLGTLNFGTAASPWAPANRGLAGMDEAIAFRLFSMVGVAAPHATPFQLRVIDGVHEESVTDQYNGDLWGLYLAFENPSRDFLQSHDLPDGNLFRMQGGRGELESHGIGLPDDRSDLNAFISRKTGYNVQPSQPVEWWRQNIDLDSYYSYRSVVEALNHSDLRDGENMLLYFNPDIDKWSMLPWDTDLLYEEFDRWGPDGVQNASQLEQFRKALSHEDLNIEFQNRARELQDLLLNKDQGALVVEEYARYVEDFAAIDRAQWDHHPRTTSQHKGAFYSEVYHYPPGNGAAGETRRAINPVGFEGMVNWVKDFISRDGFGGGQLAVLAHDPLIPNTPTIFYTGADNFPANDLNFRVSEYQDSQGEDTFAAVQWRIGRVANPTTPSFDASQPWVYEVQTVWTSGKIDTLQLSARIPSRSVEVGSTYRARVRYKDTTGRWSHWSEPAEFTVGNPTNIAVSGLKISEIHFNPSPPSNEELAAGYTDNDDFEFIEILNTSKQTVDLAHLELNGGVSFSFSTSNIAPLASGERLVVVEDVNAFQHRYGNKVPVAGQWTGRLSNDGEQLRFVAGATPILAFEYDDAWHPSTDGDGFSLELVDPFGRDTAFGTRAAWQPSKLAGGTPGSAGQPIPGDSNHDGVFNSRDLEFVLQAGKYEDGIPNNATFEEGDWNDDGDFDHQDFVAAFIAGFYVADNGRAARILAAAVDEIHAEHDSKQTIRPIPIRPDMMRFS